MEDKESCLTKNKAKNNPKNRDVIWKEKKRINNSLSIYVNETPVKRSCAIHQIYARRLI